MEVSGATNYKPTVFFMEFFGTFLFVSGACTGNYMSIPFSLFASILIFGSITGGHFNPAVSLGVYIKEKKWGENLPMLLLLWVAQFLGAIASLGSLYLQYVAKS